MADGVGTYVSNRYFPRWLNESYATAYRGVIGELDMLLLMVYYIRELLKGVQYMHQELNYVHRDIKPDNITIKDETSNGTTIHGGYHYLQPKLIDFGLAVETNPTDSYGYAGTPIYIPYKYNIDMSKVGSDIDIYGVAISIAEHFGYTSSRELSALITGRLSWRAFIRNIDDNITRSFGYTTGSDFDGVAHKVRRWLRSMCLITAPPQDIRRGDLQPVNDIELLLKSGKDLQIELKTIRSNFERRVDPIAGREVVGVVW